MSTRKCQECKSKELSVNAHRFQKYCDSCSIDVKQRNKKARQERKRKERSSKK